MDIAIEAHETLVRILPFEDGNGRCARILMNQLLVQFGYPITFCFPEAKILYWSACEIAHVDNNLDHLKRLFCEACNRSLDLFLSIYQGEPTIEQKIQEIILM